MTTIMAMIVTMVLTMTVTAPQQTRIQIWILEILETLKIQILETLVTLEILGELLHGKETAVFCMIGTAWTVEAPCICEVCSW